MRELKLPNLGENITHGDVVRVLVAKGDSVRFQQTLIELETDKALIEIPSEVAGKVVKVHVSEGDRIKVGQIILTVEESKSVADELTPPAIQHEPPAAIDPAPEQSSSSAPSATASTAPAAGSGASIQLAKPQVSVNLAPPVRPAAASSSSEPDPAAVTPAAGPATRRVARELGVDLKRVRGSGSGGRVTSDDVREYVQRMMEGRGAAIEAHASPDLPDFGQWGPVTVEPLNAVRRKTAEHLGQSWHTIPQVTQFDYADITALEDLRQRLKTDAAERGVKLTTTVFLLKAIVSALRSFPRFNCSLDVRNEQLILKHYYHIGIAVDTPRGLLVPVIRDVDNKDVWQLAAELGELAERARLGRAELAELRGATFSLSNQGGIGGTHFTPLVNHPEVAILGTGQSRTEPLWDEHTGSFAPRLLLPLALSYDHRAVDGADAARFISKLKRSLEDPPRLLLGL